MDKRTVIISRALYFVQAFSAYTFLPLLLAGSADIFRDLAPRLFLVFGVVWCMLEAHLEPAQFAQRSRDRIIVALSNAGIMAALAGAVYDYAHLPGLLPRDSWLTLLGLVIASLGLALRYSAIRTLGIFFSHALRIAGDHRLVREGPYRYLRHPAYAGLATIVLGLALLLSSPIGLFTTLCVVLGLVARSSSEERMLRLHFGDAYKQYQLQTKRLVPFLW